MSKKDFLLLIFNERVFLYCGKINSRKHILVIVMVKYFVKLRDKYINKINVIKGNNYTKNEKFVNIILNLYFAQEKNITNVFH